jgi:DNA uptake protein ComE-like DNA-binding protein
MMPRRLFAAAIAGSLLVSAIACAFAQTRQLPGQTPANLIDLNSASRDDLMTLDGIGEVRADAIIRARPFKAKSELVERRLIPESLYEKIADKVVARPPPGTTPTPTTRPPAGQPRRS